MYFNRMHCCGVGEITGISYYASSRACLLDFCQLTIAHVLAPPDPKASSYYQLKPTPPKKHLRAHYIFTAAIYDEETRASQTSYQNLLYSEAMFNTTYKLYGSVSGHALADYIREHQLGEVVTSPATFNEMLHPDHKVQVWTWTPNVDALVQWYRQEKQPKEA